MFEYLYFHSFIYLRICLLYFVHLWTLSSWLPLSYCSLRDDSHFFERRKDFSLLFSFQITFLRLSCAISSPFINNTDSIENIILTSIPTIIVPLTVRMLTFLYIFYSARFLPVTSPPLHHLSFLRYF